jgi:Ca2+-binding RTX toxin-like protein
MMRKAFFAGMLGLGAVLVGAPTALASTVTVSGGDTIRVTAGGNQTNTIAVAFTQGTMTYTVTDSTSSLTVSGMVCKSANSHTATCPGAGITKITMNLGNRRDTAWLDPLTIPLAVSSDLAGEAGNDSISGAKGRDTVRGGTGRDALNGAEGADDINGGTNFDILLYADRTTPLFVTIGSGVGNDGNELDQTGLVRDTVRSDVEGLIGGTAGDLFIGDSSSERLNGGDGNDILIGLAGSDSLDGFLGDDQLIGGTGNNLARGSFGNDILRGGPNNDVLAAGPDDDLIRGKKGADVMRGKGGIDHIKAKDGFRDVTINCGPGPKKLQGAKRDKRRDPKPKNC